MEIYEHPKRSIEQHRSEWLYYQIIAHSTGHTAYEIYERIASEILKVVLEDGEVGYIRPATLNTMLHNEYMEQVRWYAAEIGIILPDPKNGIDLELEFKKNSCDKK